MDLECAMELPGVCKVVSAQKLGAMALAQGLYCPDGQLQFYLHHMQEKPEEYTAVGVWKEERLTALAIVDHQGLCQVYVDPQHRRQGWGAQAVSHVLFACPRPTSEVFAHPGDGFIESVRFWNRCGVSVRTARNQPAQWELIPEEKSLWKEAMGLPLAELLTYHMLTALYVGAANTGLPMESPWFKRLEGLIGFVEGDESVPVEFNREQDWVAFGMDQDLNRCALVCRHSDGSYSPSTTVALRAPEGGWEKTLVWTLHERAIPLPAHSLVEAP